MTSDLIYGFGFAILATIISAFGALFFKYTSRLANKNILNLLKNHFLYLGFFFYGISALIYVFALKFGDLATIYPIAGLNYVWVSLLSIKFLKEKMNDLKWLGIIMILIGILFVGYGA